MLRKLKPSECIHRKRYGQSNYCEHQRRASRHCTLTDDPIDYCPLSPEEEQKMLQPYLRREKINKIIKK
jgi:hypothetical protein